jgi:hypothetical protein
MALYVGVASWAAISLASGGSALSFWGAFGGVGERRVCGSLFELFAIQDL